MRIKRLQLGGSIQFRSKEWVSINAERDGCSILFDKGVFVVQCLKTGEQVCFATTNVKHWVPDREPVLEPIPEVAVPELANGLEIKRRGRSVKESA